MSSDFGEKYGGALSFCHDPSILIYMPVTNVKKHHLLSNFTHFRVCFTVMHEICGSNIYPHR